MFGRDRIDDDFNIVRKRAHKLTQLLSKTPSVIQYFPPQFFLSLSFSLLHISTAASRSVMERLVQPVGATRPRSPSRLGPPPRSPGSAARQLELLV